MFTVLKLFAITGKLNIRQQISGLHACIHGDGWFLLICYHRIYLFIHRLPLTIYCPLQLQIGLNAESNAKCERAVPATSWKGIGFWKTVNLLPLMCSDELMFYYESVWRNQEAGIMFIICISYYSYGHFNCSTWGVIITPNLPVCYTQPQQARLRENS